MSRLQTTDREKKKQRTTNKQQTSHSLPKHHPSPGARGGARVEAVSPAIVVERLERLLELPLPLELAPLGVQSQRGPGVLDRVVLARLEVGVAQQAGDQEAEAELAAAAVGLVGVRGRRRRRRRRRRLLRRVPPR